jgi:hypothetical protein
VFWSHKKNQFLPIRTIFSYQSNIKQPQHVKHWRFQHLHGE